MKLERPLLISARLLPAIKIGTAWLSYDYKDSGDFYLDVDGKTHVITDFHPGPSHTIVQCFDDILAFMGACAEGLDYELRTGQKSENGDLFEADVAEWIYANRTAIEEMQCELMEEENVEMS